MVERNREQPPLGLGQPKCHRLEVGDPTDLTERDWVEVQKLWSHCGSSSELDRALADLCNRDLTSYMRVMRAILPHQMKQAIRDETAKAYIVVG